MPLHLIKLAVGCESVKELKGWVAERMRTAKKKGLPRHHIHITRMTPKRVDEMLAGGSLYWVIRGEIAAREKIIAIEPFRDTRRHRAMPAGDAAQGDRGAAAADAAVPGLALFRAKRRAAGSRIAAGAGVAGDARAVAPRTARSRIALSLDALADR